MKKVYLLLLLFVLSCKSDKKDVLDSESTNTEKTEEVKTPKFEDKLMDFRKVNIQFNQDYKLQNFGIQKINDSIFAYVFELDKTVTTSTVEAFSIGMKAYSVDLEEPIRSSYSPNIENRDGKNYIIIPQKLTTITYLDSLEAFIYQRKNWKASGRLGTLKVRDILLDNKK